MNGTDLFTNGNTTTAFSSVGAGAPIVLLHGAEADRRMFDRLAGLLAEHATVISYDQRDCGGSTTEDEAYDLADLADDLVALLNHLELPRAHLMGQSLGGLIAQLVAAQQPERIDRLVLASTFRAGMSLADIDPAASERLMSARQSGSGQAIAELFLSASYLATGPDALAAWSGIAPTTSPEQQARRSAAMQSPVPAVDLASISAPTLVAHGSADRIIPIDHARANAALLRSSRFVELDGVGHVSPLEAPEMLAAAVAEHLRADDGN